MQSRRAIQSQPEWQPQQSDETSYNKHHLPTPRQRDRRDRQRRENRANVGARVEQAGRETAFALWKPFDDRLHRRRKGSALASAERAAREHELADAARGTDRDLRERP